MIRLIDAMTLAYTKLRTHKIRTGLTIGVAGILFGLILAVIMVAQGVFDSIERFSQEGLGNRMILLVSKMDMKSFRASRNMDDPEFIAEVERYHADYVTKKTALAKKYNISYDPKTEDPSPIEIDKDTKQKRLSDMSMANEYVSAVIERRANATYVPFDIASYIAKYPSAKVLENNATVSPSDGQLVFMTGGKELISQDKNEYYNDNVTGAESPSLTIANKTLTKPFVVSSFDATKGEIPVIVAFSRAEKLLGLAPLSKKATSEQHLERLREVRHRIGEVTASYCYRNKASQQLLAQAVAQQQEMARMKNTEGYEAPSLQYALPAEDSCGEVTIAKDVRTAAEKRQDEQRIAYQKELGEYPGDPVQRKIIVRGVGVSGDQANSEMFTVGGLVSGLLGSWLGDMFVIPADLLGQMPADSRPDFLFPLGQSNVGTQVGATFRTDSYFVEFTDKKEARAALEVGGMFGAMYDEDAVTVMPYGNSVLVVDELKTWFQRILFWVLTVVGGVALIILASLIGRTVADGRRESAIFRAIGARRGDIASIYGMYALLLSIRVAVFALVLGSVLALTAHLLLWRDATIGARLAYAAVDTTKEFYLFSIASWYIPLVLGAIIAVGLVASIIPIIFGTRRNPIRDMRNE